ncbi:MAG: hypothetical protein JWN32_3409 [Solirubrobacterales bacterium]|nr:hypothetical protein [Solirubrobacterales bacterium]
MWRDPVADLYPVLRLQPRRQRERRLGVARAVLDLADAAELVRRFLHELTGTLPPDLDQVDERDV